MSYDNGLVDPGRAQQFLASRLRLGTLVLFLGSGASQGLGLPGWVDLVNRLRTTVRLPLLPATSSAIELQLAAQQVQKKCASKDKYFRIIKESLYRDINSLTTDVLRRDLLIAIGSLLIGSKRGNVRRVVTLNFDSMLEWFLLLHGYVFRVVHTLPELEGSEDVRIYHPHGFLPHPSLGHPDSKELIFSIDSVNRRLGTTGDQWHEMTRHIIRSGVCLFVGLSETTFLDPNLAPLLTKTSDEVKNSRVTGIWLLKDKITIRDQFLDNNVVPIRFHSEKAIANFLLGVCQQSAVSSPV